MPFCTVAIPSSMQNVTETVPKEPLHRGLSVRGVAKYSAHGHVEGCIMEVVQDMTSGTVND